MNVWCNGSVAVINGSINFGVDMGSNNDLLMYAICCYSNSCKIPMGFKVRKVGNNGGPHSSSPYHNLLLIIILKKFRYMLLPCSYEVSAKLCILWVDIITACLLLAKFDLNIVLWSSIKPRYLN